MPPIYNDPKFIEKNPSGKCFFFFDETENRFNIWPPIWNGIFLLFFIRPLYIMTQNSLKKILQESVSSSSTKPKIGLIFGRQFETVFSFYFLFIYSFIFFFWLAWIWLSLVYKVYSVVFVTKFRWKSGGVPWSRPLAPTGRKHLGHLSIMNGTGWCV